MDQAQGRERYGDEAFATSAAWSLGTEGYPAHHPIPSGHEYSDFSFETATGTPPVSAASMYGIPTPPLPQHSFAPPWPSMLAHAHHASHIQMPQHVQAAPMQSIPPQPLPPLVTTQPAQPQPPQQSSQRRTLTDQDRRRMCQYHEDNPTVKQTEIGAMFGVERSTVSKVLRQKEKYLAIDDGSKSPIRRAKGKFPDIERALSNWAAKHQQKGMKLDDDLIREKARFFAASVGNPEASIKVSSPSWLEKFKQKNQISSTKQRKGSSANSDLATQRQLSRTPSGLSPISPRGLETSPLSPNAGRAFDTKAESPATDTSGTSRLLHSKSSASLSSALSDSQMAMTGLNTVATPSTYPDPHKYSQQVADANKMMPPSGSDNHRPRSQTFPMLGLETSQMTFGNAGLTEAQMEEMMAGSAVLSTPQEEYVSRSLSATSLSSTDFSHTGHSQAKGMIGRGLGEHSPSSMGQQMDNIHSSPVHGNMALTMGLPTLEQGKRGLEVAMGFLTTLPSGLVEPEEYATLHKLMDKLNGLGSFDGQMPGGMHPIDVKKEMARERGL